MKSKKTKKTINKFCQPDTRKFICQVRGVDDDKVKGHIYFTEKDNVNYTEIKLDLHGLPEGPRGFHIHERGNLLDGCTSLCGHFNPHHKTHGGLNHTHSHVGDLGNIIVKKDGTCTQTIKSKFIRLRGKANVLGRSVVIHEKEDDLGNGGDEESLKTGNAGRRIACGVIGYF